MVVAGDNLFSQDIQDFGAFCLEKKTPVLGVHDVGRLTHQEIQRGPYEYQRANHLLRGKTPEPHHHGHRDCPLLLPQGISFQITQYVKDGNNADQPGRMIQWLYLAPGPYLTLPALV